MPSKKIETLYAKVILGEIIGKLGAIYQVHMIISMADLLQFIHKLFSKIILKFISMIQFKDKLSNQMNTTYIILKRQISINNKVSSLEEII